RGESPSVAAKNAIYPVCTKHTAEILEISAAFLRGSVCTIAIVRELTSRSTQSSLQFGRVLVRDRCLQDSAADSLQLFQHPLPRKNNTKERGRWRPLGRDALSPVGRGSARAALLAKPLGTLLTRPYRGQRSAPRFERPPSFRGRGTKAPLLARHSKGGPGRGGVGSLALPPKAVGGFFARQTIVNEATFINPPQH